MLNSRTKKLLLGVGAFILAFMLFVGARQNTNDEVLIEDSIIASQSKIDDSLKSRGYTIDDPNVVVNPYGISPLSALVIFETEENVTPVVVIEGKDELSTYTHEFSSGKEHYLPIYGLYPDTENVVTISFGYEEKEIIIKTDPLPNDFPTTEIVKSDESKLSNDLYFFTPAMQSYTFAADVNGDIRWYLDTIAIWKIDRLENGRLLLSSDRPINPPYYNTGLVEMDMLGKVYTEFALPGGYHHDYFELENGNLIVASDDFSGDTVEDIIVEVDRSSGDIVKTIDLKDILPMHSGKSEQWIDYDWFHNNSTWYDEETDQLILSGRHQDAVVSIDYSSTQLNWIIGDPTNWDEEYLEYFFEPIGGEFEWQWSQHAAMITPEGYIFILDNGNNKSKIEEDYVPATDSYTRGVMYEINTDEMTIEQVWEYGKDRGSDFYSPYISDVDYIDEDHYIVHSGGVVLVDGVIQNAPAGLTENTEMESYTVELLNNKVIFEINVNTNLYRVEKMSLYGNDEFELVTGKYRGSLGETVKDDVKVGIHPLINSIDDTYESHNISFVKESDRLVFEGQFLQGTNVQIVLNKGFVSSYYNLKVSKKPYTALCVDVYTEEETENGIVVNKYINDEGLDGKYDIYLMINDTLYNTNEYVVF